MSGKKGKSELTPLMEQYLQIKQSYKDMILLYRMGDFYETFFDDAKTISRILGIALTKRSHGKGGDAPLAGFPYHALENYLPRLVEAGKKVAICEQVEDPKKAKGIVKRDVVEIVTPGTTLSEKLLDNKKNNFLGAVCFKEDFAGVGTIDVSTGQFIVSQLPQAELGDFLHAFGPREILVAKSQKDMLEKSWRQNGAVLISEMDDWLFSYDYSYDTIKNHFNVANLRGFGIEESPLAVVAGGVILNYLFENYKNKLSHISGIQNLRVGDYMFLDESTRRNLELTANAFSGQKEGSLLDIIDFTLTPMGGRLLKQWLNKPLIARDKIQHRQDVVDFYFTHLDHIENIQEILGQISDLERMTARLAAGRISPREMLFLKKSLEKARELDDYLNSSDIPEKYVPVFENLNDVIELIDSSINENAPVNLKDGNIIKTGYSAELDELKQIATSGKDWLVDYQMKEREATGISSLKIGYNRVFGYYLEVTSVHKDKVPEYYIRKQTLTNAERYITPALKEYEDKILGAEEKIAELEYTLFQQIREKVEKYIAPIQKNAGMIAELDVLLGFAHGARVLNYTRPEISEENVIEIRHGRHPVVERFLPPGKDFIANDVRLDDTENQIHIITGPNMAGKSTFLRQVGLIVLLAQVGSFVPAESARIGVCDRIFTRVGASDNLAFGESTFMVEMIETANILHNATPRSLILLDEIGRGTSTFDGLSIAWSIAEYLHNNHQVAAKTLFATHYHELTELAILYPRVKNYNVSVKEIGDEVVFLRKIIPGGTDNSYGIHVARMAGLPENVIERAREILNNLEANELNPNKEPKIARRRSGRQVDINQMTIFDVLSDSPVEKEIKDLDINNLTPVEALNKLNELKKLLKS